MAWSRHIIQNDKALILGIISSIILGLYGFPKYLTQSQASSVAIIGQREIGKAMGWYGIFLLIASFAMQLSMFQ